MNEKTFRYDLRLRKLMIRLSHRRVWADNGDTLSRQYTGTGAMKRDITKTGKRTLEGVCTPHCPFDSFQRLNDGKIFFMRLYLNNFVDGQKQDAIVGACLESSDVEKDLVLGNAV